MAASTIRKGDLPAYPASKGAVGNLQDVIEDEMGLGRGNSYAVSLVKQLKNLYLGTQLEKELGHGSFSTVYSFTYRGADGKIHKKALKLARIEKVVSSKTGYQLNRDRMGGEWMAFLSFGERVLRSDEAIVYDIQKKEMILVGAAEIRELFHHPDLREGKEWALIGAVMEFVDGSEDFLDIIEREGELPTESIRKYGRMILEGMAAIQAKSPEEEGRTLIHRDLKPENILLMPEEGATLEKALKEGKGTAKIIDFGFSRLTDGEKRHTRCGTPAYVAPEILADEAYGKKAELYSLGAILSVMATARLHVTPENFMVKMADAIATGDNLLGAHLARHYSKGNPDLRDLITRLGEMDPADRPTIAEALAHRFFNPPSP